MNALLRVDSLSVGFQNGPATTLAVKNVSFSVNRGEILAIVGESGSGKSVSALSILQLLPSPPAKYVSGKILFSEDGVEEENLLQKNRIDLQRIRGNKIAMIFQEPMTSLNPVFNCGEQVLEAIRLHKKVTRAEAKRQAIEWFEKVKLPEPPAIFRRFPHQLSGGQKQRVMIAMAMCCHPSLLICDEPTTALDVTVQEAILQLIAELQREENMGIIFITHDLAVVGAIANRAAVMYAGEIVEQNTTREIFTNPSHPYTRALLACRPANHAKGERLPVVSDFLNTIETPEDISQVDLESGKNEASYQPVSLVLQQEKSVKKLLEIKELSVWFPKRHSLLGVPKSLLRLSIK